MQQQETKVDVLAVVDAAIYERGVSAATIAEARGMVPDSQLDECDRRLSLLSDARTDDARKLHEARAAIAELILFADTAEKALRNAVTAEQIHHGNLNYADDLRAALARVGGVK